MDTFKLEWSNDDLSIGEKEVDRTDFFNLMDGIRKTFSNNNVYSKKFVEIIPKMESMSINHKRNEQLDVPFVVCIVDGEKQVLNIPRNNKIIWGILNELTK